MTLPRLAECRTVGGLIDLLRAVERLQAADQAPGYGFGQPADELRRAVLRAVEVFGPVVHRGRVWWSEPTRYAAELRVMDVTDGAAAPWWPDPPAPGTD